MPVPMGFPRPYIEAVTDRELIHAGPLGAGAKLELCFLN